MDLSIESYTFFIWYRYIYIIIYAHYNKSKIFVYKALNLFIDKRSFTNRIFQTLSVSFSDRYLISEMVGRHSHPQTCVERRSVTIFKTQSYISIFPEISRNRHQVAKLAGPYGELRHYIFGSAHLRARPTIAVMQPRKKSCIFKTNRVGELSG